MQQHSAAIAFIFFANPANRLNLRFRFTLTIRALFNVAALLHLFFAFGDGEDLFFYLLVFVLVASAGQLVVEVHVDVFLL